MSKRTVLVIGAAGDVGRGIVAAALESGRRVVASGRSIEKLRSLSNGQDSATLACVAGDVANETSATALWNDAKAAFGDIHEVVVTVNVPSKPRPLFDWSAQALSSTLSDNMLTHFNAAKTFLPRLPADGMLLGIGGGTADFIFPQMAHASIAQAALRNLYRGIAREHRAGAAVRELMIVSMVNGRSNRDSAKPEWLTEAEIGRHVCAIFDAPQNFPDAILQLKSREQVGQPDSRTRESAKA